MQAVQPAGILCKDSAPGNWHGQKQGVQPRIIEPPPRDNDPSLPGPVPPRLDGRQGFACHTHLLSAQSTMENDDVLRKLR
jgi:hypothetical protein